MFRTSLFAALAATILAAPTLATTYDEAVSGDLSSDAAHPTSIGALTPGSNQLSGSTVPSGTFDPMTHSFDILDNDYASFTVKAGYKLTAINVGNGTVIDPADRMFVGIANGSSVSVAPDFSSAAGLLGWTLVGAAAIGTSILPDLGASAPAMFPSIPGATGFSGALGAGTYTLWLLDGDRPATYAFDLVTQSVPEPATWAMLLCGFGFVGTALRRRTLAVA